MAESALPPSSAAAPAAEPEVTEQPGPRSPPPSPPGLEEPLDGADPDVPHPDLAPVAFFCLRQTTSPRNWCIKMVCNPWFECVSMLVILLNCVTLGMYQPCDDMDCLTDRCKILQVFDDFIFIFFAMEMVLKMVALGIFGKKCYLGDTWNRLDFFIVMAGMVEYSLDLQNINLSAIRTVRVLRPLKAINRVPSMRILVNLLLDTLPMLGNVLLLCFFVFFIFGIIGVQLWAGLLRNRCFLEENFTIQGDVALPPYYQPEEDDEMPFICSLSGDNGIMGCHEIPPLKEQGRECCLSKDDVYDFGAGRQDLNASGLCVNWNRYYNVCRTGSANPHKGAINFDNIGYAWIVIFQVITLEGWVEIMYYVMDAHSFYNFIYFILLIIVSVGQPGLVGKLRPTARGLRESRGFGSPRGGGWERAGGDVLKPSRRAVIGGAKVTSHCPGRGNPLGGSGLPHTHRGKPSLRSTSAKVTAPGRQLVEGACPPILGAGRREALPPWPESASGAGCGEGTLAPVGTWRDSHPAGNLSSAGPF
nr:voltage-dependent T-type calcium channel subunit alpha-1I [Oryctolagus cuniculus]